MKICFYVTGEPKGQPRPRAFARKFGEQWQARVYDAHTAEGWKSCVAAAWLQNKPAGFQTLTGPLALQLTFFVKRPKAHFLKAGLRPDAPYYCESKPDADNLSKAVLDCLTRIGAWEDDAQICELLVVKRYVAADVNPGACVTIEALSKLGPDRRPAQAGED